MSMHARGYSKLSEVSAALAATSSLRAANQQEKDHPYIDATFAEILEEDMGAVIAAIHFVIQKNGLDEQEVMRHTESFMEEFRLADVPIKQAFEARRREQAQQLEHLEA